MKARIDTTPFENSHLRMPRGKGTWFFCTKSDPDAPDAFMTASTNATYAEAKKDAIKYAQQYGIETLYVLP